MIVHVFSFRWRPEATEADQRRALEEIRALAGQIPVVLEAHVGINFSPHGGGYSLAGMMKFADREALATYGSHPAHQRVLAWLTPLVELVELDFEG